MNRLDLRRLARKSRRALRLPPREIATMVRVIVVLVCVELMIRWVPLPRLSRVLGVRVNLQPARPDAQPLPVDQFPERTRRQLRCTRRVADVWPLSQGPCLRRALVGGHLIRELDPAIRLGVIGSGDSLQAHAWLEIDDRPLETVTEYSPFVTTTSAAAR